LLADFRAQVSGKRVACDVGRLVGRSETEAVGTGGVVRAGAARAFAAVGATLTVLAIGLANALPLHADILTARAGATVAPTAVKATLLILTLRGANARCIDTYLTIAAGTILRANGAVFRGGLASGITAEIDQPTTLTFHVAAVDTGLVPGHLTAPRVGTTNAFFTDTSAATLQVSWRAAIIGEALALVALGNTCAFATTTETTVGPTLSICAIGQTG